MIALASKGPAPYPLGFSGPSIGVPPEGAAGAAIASARLDDVAEAKRAAIASIAMSFGMARLLTTQKSILRDIEVAERASAGQHWNDQSPVPPHAFAVFSTFDTDSPIGMKTVLELTSPIPDRMLDFLARHPKYLASVPPSAFEELVAELFRGFNFAVELKAQPGDGGVDVVAVHSDTKYLIQCKRKGTEKLEVGVVRELHGVVRDAPNQGSKGLMATTSWLTKPAREMVERNPLYLEAAGYDRLVRWLAFYERNRFGSLPPVAPPVEGAALTP
jgi:hypothetical protein